MVSVDALTVEFGGTTLFKDVSFVINPKDRIALMGKNGAGKVLYSKFLPGYARQPVVVCLCPRIAPCAICRSI